MAGIPVSGRVDLTGRVALVTGAARGIGRAAAEALAGEGADVVAADVGDLDDVTKAVDALGRRCVAVRADVTSRARVEAAVAAATGQLGRLDVLVTCAGVYGGGALDVDEDEWDRVQAVNVKGTYLAIQAAFPALEDGGGKIVCIGSIAGKIGGVLAGPHYAASKGAIHALVRWTAKYGSTRGVHVNGIAPGVVDTDMIKGQPYRADASPLARFGRPEDIAQAVVYLASPASNFVTGKVLSVDGGLTLMD